MIIKRKRLLGLYCDQCKAITWHDRLFSQGRHRNHDLTDRLIPLNTIQIFGRCVRCHHSQKYVTTQITFDGAWYEVEQLCQCSLPAEHDGDHLGDGWEDETIVYVCTVCQTEYPFGKRCPTCEI